MYRGSINADYGSHIPLLAGVVAKAGPGLVLELGSGDSSTPLLHYLCRGNQMLLTADTDETWLARFKDYEGLYHRIELVKDWDKFEIPETVAAAFVDCAPGHKRWELIKRLQGKAKFIIAHDSERDYGTGANYEYEKVTPLFRYVAEFRRFRPYTLVFSDIEPFIIEETDRVWEHPTPGAKP